MDLRCAAAATLLLGPLAACDEVPTYQTELAQLGLKLDGFNDGAVGKPLQTVDAMVGSRLCPVFDGWYESAADGVTYHVQDDEDDAWLRNCFATGASGAAKVDGECLVLDAAGSAALELMPHSCHTQQASGIVFVPDRLAIEGWAIDDVVLRYDDVFLRKLHELSPGPADPFPPLALADTPMQVIVGAPTMIAVQPFAHGDPSLPVGYEGGTLRAVGENVRPELQSEVATGYVAVEPGDRFAVELEIAAGTLQAGEVIAVDRAAAVSMELLVGYEPCDSCGRGWGELAMVQAILRDTDGQRLYGGEVDFYKDGFTVGDTYSDTLLPGAICEGHEGRVMSGRIDAEYGELTARVNVSYECPVPDVVADDEPEVEHDEGGDLDDDGFGPLFGCGCDAAGNSDPAAALGVLGLVALARRRRRRS